MRCYTERNKETKIRNIQQFSEVKGYGKHCVFVMLIFISLLISLFGYIPKLEEKIKNIGKKPEPVKTEEPAAVVEEPQTQVVNLQKDEQLVAVITAAIMASYGSNAVSADKLVVRSIHRVDGRRA